MSATTRGLLVQKMPRVIVPFSLNPPQGEGFFLFTATVRKAALYCTPGHSSAPTRSREFNSAPRINHRIHHQYLVELCVVGGQKGSQTCFGGMMSCMSRSVACIRDIFATNEFNKAN